MKRAAREGQFGAYEAKIFRAICAGTLIGAVLFGTGTTAMAMAVGVSWQASLVLGAFTAVWGGAGFGGMFGAIVAARRNEMEEKAAAAASRADRSSSATEERHNLAA